jgi:hypothetical protein
MDAEDVEAGAGEPEADRFAEAGRCAENESPAVETDRIGGQGHGSIVRSGGGF